MTPTPTVALVGMASIRDAATRIAGVAVRTPLLASPWPGLWLKPEGLQPTGAFKIRGAMTAMSRLDPQVRARGVLAHSSGNHAQAVAYAANVFGVHAHIVIPDNAAAGKVDATVALGASVELVPAEQRFTRCAQLAAESGRVVIAPFDDPAVIAGQGTVGLEIAQEASAVTEELRVVLVPVSGGGLIAGVAAALATLLPWVKVVGVEPELAGDAAESFRTGRRVAWPAADTARTVADGLRAPSLGELPWAHIRRQVHDIITVSEAEIRDTTRRLALQGHLLAEPSGAVAAAAWLHHRGELPVGSAPSATTAEHGLQAPARSGVSGAASRSAVAIVSGANVDRAFLAGLFDG